MFVITIIVEPPRLFPQTLPQLLDLDHKLVEFPLRRRQRPVRPRHQKETGIRPSGSFAGLEQRSLCLRHFLPPCDSRYGAMNVVNGR